MLIKILAVEGPVTKPTAKGSYQQIEVSYRNLDNGKTESRKVMSFANKDVYTTLAAGTSGQVFNVTIQKNEKTGYWDWVGANVSSEQAASNQNQTVKQTGSGNPAPRSNYETPEERAQRQVFIIRQSSVSSAINALSAGTKSAPKLEDVLEYAEGIVQYVMGNDKTAPEQAAQESIQTMENDIPY